MFTLRGQMLRLNRSDKGPLRRVFGGSATFATTAADTAVNYNLVTPSVVQFSAIKTPANNNDITADLLNNRFIINTPGRYIAIFMLPHFSTGERASLEGYMSVNGVRATAKSYSYIRPNARAHNRSDVRGRSIIDVSTGDFLTTELVRAEGSTTLEPITLLENATFGILKVNDWI